MNKADWKRWIEQQVEDVREEYLKRYKRLIQDYRQEIALNEQYNGRQLLELLQNADDESHNAKEPNVLIKIVENKLIVANNGNPFSTDGIESLRFARITGKKRRHGVIGYKGLGFRSILNWAKEICIVSGELSIKYSTDIAKEFLNELLSAQPSLKQKIEDNEVAVLTIPSWTEKPEIIDDNFDTYVILTLNDDVKEELKRQIEDLTPETLIFQNNIKQIEIDTPWKREKIVAERSIDKIKIDIIDQTDGTHLLKEWKISSKEDTIPNELIKNTEDPKEYNIKIAFNEKLDDSINKLFCYFITKEKFPFPILIHATLNLDDSRNYIIEDEINKYILNELSELLVKLAIELNKDKVNWDRLKFLAKQGDFSETVDKMGFYDSLIQQIKDKELIPTKKSYLNSLNARDYGIKELNNILVNYEEFKDLCIYTEDSSIKELIRKLEIREYSKEELTSKLNKISGLLTIQERAKLIAAICKNDSSLFGWGYKGDRPSLFIDNEKNVVKSDFDLVLPPDFSFDISLPDWISLKFIDSELTKLLHREFGTSTSRELRSQLSFFDVQEYSFSYLVRSIISSTKERLTKENNKISIVQELLKILLDIYRGKKIEQFPENIQVPLINNKGELFNAKELYFGIEYNFGEISYNLLKDVDSDHSIFLAKKDTLGLNIDEEEIKEFLIWLGVSIYPRFILKELKENYYDYETFILENLDYPLTLDNEVFQDYATLKRDISWRSKITIQTIEFIDEILEKAEWEYILAWFIKDNNLNTIIREGREINTNSKVLLSLSNKKNYREISGQKIPSYLSWILKTKSWIPTLTGKKEVPSNCCNSRNISLSPLIELPKYDPNHPILKKKQIDIKDIDLLFSKIGIIDELKELSWSKIYSLLLDLPNKDVEGKIAKSFYNQIVKERSVDTLNKRDNNYVKFMKEGNLLGEHNNIKKFYSLNELSYLENINFPKSILRRKPILVIDRKIGAKKVESILGVSQLTEDALNIKIKSFALHKLNEEFFNEFEIFKPYVYFYRIEKDSKRENLRALKNLNILLCSDIEVESDIPELIIDVNETVREKNKVYIKINKDIDKLNDLLEDDDFCDSISEAILNTLKIVDNEVEMRIKELLSKKSNRKKRFLKLNGEEALIRLEECKSLLGLILTSKISFWETIFSIKGKLLSEEIKTDEELLQDIKSDICDISKETYNKIDYDNYSSPDNYSVFKELFNHLKINLQDFNKISSKQIDFSEHLQLELKKVSTSCEQKFKVALYNRVRGELEKQKQFHKMIDEYASYDFDIPDTTFIDINEYFYRLVENKYGIQKKELQNPEDIEISKIYSQNRERILEELKRKKFDETEISKFLDSLSSEEESLIYFGNVSELITGFINTHKPIEEKSMEEKEKTAEERLADEIKKVEDEVRNSPPLIEKAEPIRPVEPEPTKEKKKTKKMIHGRRVSETEKEEIGIIGEKILYERLKLEYGEKSVGWVSSNAKKAGINPSGNDGYGYDIYYKIDGKLKYVEVKSSKNEVTSFNISKYEVEFGEKNKEDYEVWLILNCMNKDGRRIINLGNVFKYKSKDDSFNNNSNFSVENENFIICFVLN